MSIAAAENAGLGPCDLPDTWAPNFTDSNIKQVNTVACSKGSSNLATSSQATSSNTAAYINIENNNIDSKSVLFNSTKSAGTSSTGPESCSTLLSARSKRTTTSTSLIYKLPLASPAAATAAVTISTAGSDNVVTASLVGLAPAFPRGAPLTGFGGVGGDLSLRLSAATSPGGGNGHDTNETFQVNRAKCNDSTDSGTRTLKLQQEQLQFKPHSHLFLQNNKGPKNNNNILLSNNNKNIYNNNFNLTLSQKATTPGSLASAFQNSIIMNAVASPMSNNPATPTRKIRRKTDSKVNLPQSQINKCNNEKRRRELENNYIEQLSEFLQLNKRGDMTSTKPDKAAILNQVVKTYREFCDKGQSRDISSSTSTASSSASNATAANNNNANSTLILNSNKNKTNTTSTRCSRCATDNCSIHPVQQGDVSSTEPPLPEPSLLNGQVPEISAYFEALEHYLSSVDWVLLQVTADGIIESCTQNIRELIGYDKQELYRKPLYQYLYPGDHAKLEPIISNMGGGANASGGVGATGSQSGWVDLEDSAASSQLSTASVGPTGLKTKRNVAAKVRMLVKDIRSATLTTANALMAHPNDATDQKPLKQQTQSEKYEEVMLLATPMKDDGDSSSSILCLITRPEDETPMQQIQPQSIEHLTFKLDVHGKILNLDATALREPYRQHLNSWLGRLLQDLCHPQDLNALKTHLHEVQESAASVHLMSSPAAQSPGGTPVTLINPPIANVMSRPFRLRLGGPDVYVHVKANSRLFLNQSQTEGDYIMSLQTILNPDADISAAGSIVVGSSGGSSMIPPSGMPTLSPSSSLVSPLSLPLDSLVTNNSSCSSSASALVGVGNSSHLLGGLVGGGGMPPHNTQTTNVGGPLMTSAVINGTTSGGQRNSTIAASAGTISNNSTIVNSFAASPAGPEATIFYSGADPFDFDLAHSSFEMDATGWTDSRPNSRASVTTPVSTPRPPSAGHGFSPAVCASPSTPFQLSSHSAASLPSPQSNASQPSSAGPGGSQFGFGFPAFDTCDKNSEKDHINTSGSSNASTGNNNTLQQGIQMNAGSSTLGSGGNLQNGGISMLTSIGGMATPPQPDSERLRHLLTNKSHAVPSSLHSAEGDKESHMRQKLLNEKSEDDDGKGTSLGRPSELMRQLQKDDGHYGHSHGHGHGSNHSKDMSQEDLLKSLKYQGDPTTRKRSLNDPDDGISAKRENDRPSKLRENNRMLASLLENPPKNPIVTVPPQIKMIPDIAPTASRVSSTISGIGVSTSNSLSSTPSKSVAMPTTSAASASSTLIGIGRGNSLRKQFSDGYPTLQQHHQQHSMQRIQQTQQPQQTQPHINFSSSDTFVTPPHNTIATSGSSVVTSSIVTAQPNVQLAAFGNADGDSELSKILDSVMEYVSDDGPFVPTSTAMSGMTQQENPRMAINAIQNFLMVETSQLQQQHHQQQPQPPAYPGNMLSSGGSNASVGGAALTHQQQQHQLQIQHLQMIQRQQASLSGGAQSSQVQQMLEVLRVNANQGFQRPPPMYTATRNRGPMNAVTTPGGAVLPAQQQFRLRQQQQQQQQKERLLQQQQKQQLLVPESANVRTDQLCLNPNINNIGSLLNNTVAPNVALSRTNLPDSQLSPNFTQSLLQQQQQLSPGQRNAPFSPQSNAGYGSQFPQSGQRSSPHQQQHLSQQQQQQMNVQQQQQMAFQAAQTAGANVASQLSPRQPPFGGGPGQGGIQSPGSLPNTSPQQWNSSGNVGAVSNSQLSANAPTQRGHSLQQHNPMLSAQLQQGISPYSARPYQNQRRSLNSPSGGGGIPGSAVGNTISTNVGLQRQNSFHGGETGGFSGTTASPSPQSPYGGPGANVFQQQHIQQRIQRQNSVPQSAQHLPGGNASNSSDFVKQELRAVVSVRAQQHAAAAGGAGTSTGGNGLPGSSGGNGGPGSMRISTTPQSPLNSHQQGPIVGGGTGGMNNTSSLNMQQQQAGTLGTGGASTSAQNAMLNTPPDAAMHFNFDTQDFFGSSSTR